MKECCDLKYHMGTRLDSVTTDNGANFKAAVKQLLEDNIIEETPSCACHTFNLVIKDAVNPCKKKVSEYTLLFVLSLHVL